MFASGVQGVWYDPSDFTTLFQDAAGTIPVTAVEQPVGRINDKSGRGNHASQSTATSRPVLSARVNLVLATEVITGSAGTTATPDAILSPKGTLTADLITETEGTSEHYAGDRNISVTAGVNYTWSAFVKDGPSANRLFYLRAAVAVNITLLFNPRLKTIVNVGGTGIISSGFEELPNGWFRVWMTFTAQTTSDLVCRLQLFSTTTVYPGVLGSGLYIWGADLRVANQANLPSYQRVNTATDYDTAGFPPYLKFDGIDDSFATDSINFTSTDKMTVFTGVRKLSDATFGMILELSNTTDTNNGSFFVGTPRIGQTSDYWLRSKGTTNSETDTSASYLSPITNVLSASMSISTDALSVRINGVLDGSSATDQGTGNFGNYPLYIGRRGGTTLPFNGHLYSLIVRGAQSSAAQITSAETYCNSKTKAY
jgi:hypothetical protein